MSNDLGLPDIGLTTLDQVSHRAKQITRVTDLPTIVDADTGFGNCKKTIKILEEKGLAGCHIEDQIAEKRCGHLDNKELISKEDMVLNNHLPEIEVHPETYEVRADGELLTCEPAQELPMAQRYFLF